MCVCFCLFVLFVDVCVLVMFDVECWCGKEKKEG